MSDNLSVVGHYTEMWLRKLNSQKRAIASELDKEKVEKAARSVDQAKEVTNIIADKVGKMELATVEVFDPFVVKFRPVVVEILEGIPLEPEGALEVGAKWLPIIRKATNNIVEAMKSHLPNVQPNAK